jgi:hypothetical protein
MPAPSWHDVQAALGGFEGAGLLKPLNDLHDVSRTRAPSPRRGSQ